MNSNSSSEPNIQEVQVGLFRQLALINAAIHHSNSSENTQVRFIPRGSNLWVFFQNIIPTPQPAVPQSSFLQRLFVVEW